MLDSHILTLYTDALYSNPPEVAPTYHEFRDMLSRGQLYSKFWLVNELKKIPRELPIFDEQIVIVGAGFGMLAFFLRNTFIFLNIKCLSPDPRFANFINTLKSEHQPDRVIGLTEDIYKYNYADDIIINTRCERMTHLEQWLTQIPTGKLLVLQTNNFTKISENINCVNSLQQFLEQVNGQIAQPLFSGYYDFPNYTRYMIIALKK